MISYTFYLIYLFNKIDGNIYYGQYILLGSVLSVVSSFTGVSSSEGVVYFLSKENINKKKILLWSFLLDLFFCATLLIFIFFSKSYISIFIDDIDFLIIILFGLKIIFKNIRNSLTGLWQYENKFKFIYVFNLIENLFLFFTIIYIDLFKKAFSLIALVNVELIVSLSFAFIYFSFYLNKIRKMKSSKNKQKISLRYFFQYNLKLFISRSIKSGNQKIDNIILGAMLSTSEVAIYDKIKKIFLPINLMVNPFREIYLTKILKLSRLKRFDLIKLEIINSSKIIFIITLILIFMILIFKYQIFNVLIIENHNDNNMIFYSLVFVALYTASFWWVRLISNTFNPNISIKANLISTLLLLSISPILIYFFGFKGLGFSLIINFLILAFFWFLNFKIYVIKKDSY
tara:strand:- start:14646 stop:15848 length:1203 start_codon:yes stop_codon:yes gene_type:complete